MARKKEMCSSENHEPGAGIVLMKLEELHSFEGHPFKVERNQELFELRCSMILSIVFRKFYSSLTALITTYRAEHFPSRMLCTCLSLTGNGQTGSVYQAVSA